MLDIVACIKDTKPQRNREMCFSAETDQEIYSCREIELGKCCDVMNQLGIYIASLVCSKLSWCPYFFRNKRCFLLHGMVVALRLGLWPDSEETDWGKLSIASLLCFLKCPGIVFRGDVPEFPHRLISKQSLGPTPGVLSRLRERLVMKPKTTWIYLSNSGRRSTSV